MLAATDGPLLGVNAWDDEGPEPADEPEGFIDECDELATPDEVCRKIEKLSADLVLAVLRSDPPATPVPDAAISFTIPAGAARIRPATARFSPRATERRPRTEFPSTPRRPSHFVTRTYAKFTGTPGSGRYSGSSTRTSYGTRR